MITVINDFYIQSCTYINICDRHLYILEVCRCMFNVAAFYNARPPLGNGVYWHLALATLFLQKRSVLWEREECGKGVSKDAGKLRVTSLLEL